MNSSIFGTRMRQARKDKGWTQRRLAQEYGAAQATISLYERGFYEPTLSTATCIARALGVSLDWLTGREEK
jgi:transcriptional regulator with XRE-family HTH domain